MAALALCIGVSGSAFATVPISISYSTTTGQSTTAQLNQFAGTGTTIFPGTTGSTAATPATLTSFNSNLGILTGASISVSIPYTLTVIAIGNVGPNGSGRTVDVNSTLSASVSLAGASIAGASFAASPKCNSGDCLNGNANNTQTFAGTFSGTQTVAAANLAQLATTGAGTVSFGSTVFGTNTTVINGSGVTNGGARTTMTLGSTTTAQNQYSVTYNYVKYSTPSFSLGSVVTNNVVNLGTRFVDEGPFGQAFVIANIGDANTAGTSLINTARSVNDSRFTTNFTSLTNLTAGTQQGFNVSFAPTVAGSFSETFTFTMQDHAPGGVGLKSTPLALTANATVLNRANPSFNPVSSLLNQTLDFGTVNYRGGPVTLNFVLYNIGNSNSAGLQLVSSTGTNSQFSTSLTALPNLPGGQSQMLSVTFTPTSLGLMNNLFTFVLRDYAPAATSSTMKDYTLTLSTIANVYDPVPEPAAWSLMIAGFGLVGVSLRRRTAAA